MIGLNNMHDSLFQAFGQKVVSLSVPGLKRASPTAPLVQKIAVTLENGTICEVWGEPGDDPRAAIQSAWKRLYEAAADYKDSRK